MGLDWAELDTLVSLRDGILRPGTPESAPEERTRIQKDTAQRVYAYFGNVGPSADSLLENCIFEALNHGVLKRHGLAVNCLSILRWNGGSGGNNHGWIWPYPALTGLLNCGAIRPSNFTAYMAARERTSVSSMLPFGTPIGRSAVIVALSVSAPSSG